MKFVDRQGRVDKFLKKMQTAQHIQQTKKGKKAKSSDTSEQETKSYKDILREQQTVMKKADKAEKTA